MSLSFCENTTLTPVGLVSKLVAICHYMLVGENAEEGAVEERKERFAEIVGENEGMIRRICFGYSRTKEEMEDLFQDVLLNIWQSLPKFRGESSVKTWIYRVSLNTCVSTIRKKPKTACSNLPDVIDESEERRRRLMELHDMISLLPTVDKAIVLLWLDETSYEDIALITGLTRNTVATRLRRAKEKLKNL